MKALLAVPRRQAQGDAPAADAPLPVRLLPLPSGLGAHRRAWDVLNNRLYGGHPMLAADFIDPLLHTFGDDHVRLAVLGPVAEPVGMALLHWPSTWRAVSFRPAQLQIGPTLLARPADRMALLRGLPRTTLVLDLLCNDPDLLPHTIDPVHGERHEHAVTISVDLEGGFDAYWRARPASLRQNVDRRLRHVADDGLEPRFVQHIEPQAVSDALQRYAELESAGWKGREGTSLKPGGAQTRFYADALDLAARQGQAAVAELWLGGRLAASRLILQRAGRLVMLKTTYDESLARHAPGRLLLRQYLEWAYRERAGWCVEFCTNAGHEQVAWATRHRSITHIRLQRFGVLGLASRLARRLRPVSSLPEPLASNHTVTVSDIAGGATTGPLHGALTGRAGPIAQDISPRQQASAGSNTDASCWFSLAEGRSRVAAVALDRRGGHAYSAVIPPGERFDAWLQIEPWVRTAELAAVFRDLRREWPGVHRVTLGALDPNAREFLVLRSALEDAGFVTFKNRCSDTWRLRVPGEGWQAVAGSLPVALRDAMLRDSASLAERGISLSVLEPGPDLHAAIDAAGLGLDLFGPAPGPHAVARETLHDWARRGALRLGLASVEGCAVGAQAWWVREGHARLVARADGTAPQAPPMAAVMGALVMQHLIDDEGIAVIESKVGEGDALGQWLTGHSAAWCIEGLGPWSAAGLIAIARQTATPRLAACGAMQRGVRP